MPSSRSAGGQLGSTAEQELIEKIEELSFLRTLNDRLARCPDYATACQTLVDLVWDDGWADEVSYWSVDGQRRACRLEARAPLQPDGEPQSSEVPSGAIGTSAGVMIRASAACRLTSSVDSWRRASRFS